MTVIGVDWSYFAFDKYENAGELIPHIGDHIVKFIELLNTHKGITPSDIILVGHSLGAHISGYVGDQLKTLKRIDGI